MLQICGFCTLLEEVEEEQDEEERGKDQVRKIALLIRYRLPAHRKIWSIIMIWIYYDHKKTRDKQIVYILLLYFTNQLGYTYVEIQALFIIGNRKG